MNAIIFTNKQVVFRKFGKFDMCLQGIVLDALRICRLKSNEYAVSLLLCDDAQMQELNYKFCNKNKPTNVLSFPDGEMEGSATNLGDIAISIPTIVREAREQGKTFRTHFVHMFAHGVLHLLGQDHETLEQRAKMEQIEDEIISLSAKYFQRK